MSTRLDETYVEAALEQYPEAAVIISALASEVRRLEKLIAEIEAKAKESQK